ncbi:hypothetical protein ACG7TL_007622 [Trametes sanguinea]
MNDAMKKLFGRDKPKTPKLNHDGPIENIAHPSQRHDRLHSSPDDQWDLISETDPPLQPLRPSTLTSSQTPSLASIHQATSPAPSPLPRSASPYTVPAAPPQQQVKPNGNHKDRDQQVLRKRPHIPAANSFAAVGILRALEPHLEQVVSHDTSEDGFTDASVREEKKEKRGFWERASHRDKDKDKDRGKEREKEREKEKDRDREREKARERDRDRDRRDEDAPAELTRMIAKEAAKALRREFKYAEPAAQLSAARLWAIMLRNCSGKFVHYCESGKFLDTLEDVLGSSRTSPVVRERLLEILAAAAYMNSTDGGFKALWRKVKPADKPEEGIPFDNDDAMFYPATPRHSPPSRPHSQPRVHHDQQGATPQRPPPTVTPGKTRSSRNRVIPPEEDIRRLFQECKVGQGNASLLSESLTYAKPEDLKSKDIIKEFYARCRASQELISAQIPWAAAQAEKSREARARADPKPREGRHSVERDRTPSSPKKDKPDTEHLTTEEKLLAAILKANEELLEALRQYDDLERVGIERDAQERSKKEIRMDRSRLQYDESENSYYLEPGQATHSGAGASSSRSPSPSPSASPSPAPSLVITPTPSSLAHNHPLPPIPHQPAAASANHAHPMTQQGSITSLAPPRPAAPHGPRSPTQRSNTPSPERIPTVHRLPRTSTESTHSAARQQQAPNPRHESSEEWSDLEQEAKTPVRPSAKALGKRKVVDPPPDEDRSFDPNDIFYNHNNDSFHNSDESESEEARAKNPWHRPIHYVYDAAAERTAQRIREGRLAAAALVGGVH